MLKIAQKFPVFKGWNWWVQARVGKPTGSRETLNDVELWSRDVTIACTRLVTFGRIEVTSPNVFTFQTDSCSRVHSIRGILHVAFWGRRFTTCTRVVDVRLHQLQVSCAIRRLYQSRIRTHYAATKFDRNSSSRVRFRHSVGPALLQSNALLLRRLAHETAGVGAHVLVAKIW